MTTTDHRAELDRIREAAVALYADPSTRRADRVLAGLIDDLARVMAESRRIVPVTVQWQRDFATALDAMTDERDTLSAERDQLREESTARLSLLMKAERQAEALAEEVDGLRSERAVDLDTIERLREERDRARTQVRAVEDALGGERA